MSAEYLLKMELLRQNREELTSRRQEIERRLALREATAAEFSAVALQSSKQKWKSLRASAISAKKRNDEFIREIHGTQRKVDDMYVRTKQKLWPSDNQLEIEKARYLRKVEELYPAWQEKQQTVRVQTLRELEEKKRAIEKRRYLAKKTFETEQTLDDLIRQTNHEVELARNLEKNEAFEREILRNQSTIQSQQVEESIREHATGARMYMTQQAVEQLTEAHHLQGDVQEKIFETFSPRGAVNAMRQANQSITFVEPADNNADDFHHRPRRAQSIAVPTPQYRDQSVEEPSHSNQFDPYAHTQVVDAHDPASQARAWARSGFANAGAASLSQPVPASKGAHIHPILLPTHREDMAFTQLPIHPTRAEMQVSAASHLQPSFVTPMPAYHSPANQFPSAPIQLSTPPAHTITVDTKPSSVISSMSAQEKMLPYRQPDVQKEEQKLSMPPPQSVARVVPQPHSTPMKTKASRLPERETPPKASNARVPDSAQSMADEKASSHDPTPAVADILIQKDLIAQEVVTTHTEPVITEDEAKAKMTPARLEQTNPSQPTYETYKFVEITRQESTLTTLIEEKTEDKDCGSRSHSFDSLASANFSPTKCDVASNPTMPPSDLSLNLVNSYESNQSSLMDFSIGKLLQTPQKVDFASNANDLMCDSPPSEAGGDSPDRFDDSVKFAGLTTSIDSFAAESPDRFDSPQHPASSRTVSFEKATHKVVSPPIEERTSSSKFKSLPDYGREAPSHKTQSLVFSSSDSASELGSPAIPRLGGQDSMIESVSDFGSPVPLPESGPTKGFSQREPSPPVSPTADEDADQTPPSLISTLSMPERLKALTSLIARVEEGTSDGEQISSSLETGSSHDTKRELLRMAVSGRKAQINFFGSDVCFELVVELAKELGSILFPSKAFEGIMNDQKMKKVHHNAKEKEPEMWKAFASHIKQLHAAKAMPVGALADLFTNAFLSHDSSNQRSQRKLREFLLSICGATDNTPSKQPTPASPRQASQPSDSFLPRTSASTNSFERETTASPHQMPSLLQTAFLQASSPPKQAKSYGIASSGAKKKSSSDDVLKSMAASPTKLSQKLLRGGKMGDYSEFEEEEEINLENLIGSKSTSASSGGSSSISRATSSYRSGAGTSSSATSRFTATREDKDDFDVDF